MCVWYNITTLLADPFPPPINVELQSVNRSMLTFTWDPVAPSCPAIHYVINATNCGTCPTATNSTFITCTNPHLEAVCNLDVQSVVCDSLVGRTAGSIQVMIRGNLCFHFKQKSSHDTIACSTRCSNSSQMCTHL